jgi:hypothetical protein
VVKKPVRLDLEHEPGGPLRGPRPPARLGDDAAVVVVGRRGAADRECPEAVVADDGRRRRVEAVAVDGAAVRPLAAAAERRPRGVVQSDHVGVPARGRAEAGVELGAHRVGGGDPDVVGEHRVERAAQRVRRPLRVELGARGLTARVDAGVRPPRAQHRNRSAAEACERAFELALHGAHVALPLPAREARAVVVQDELHGPQGGVHGRVT